MPYPIYVGVLKQIKDTIIEPQTTVCNFLITSGHRDDILKKKQKLFCTLMCLTNQMEFFEVISECLNKKNIQVIQIYLDFSKVHSATLFLKTSWKT